MNNKKNREQIIHEAKSSIILDAALRVFSEKGFHEARLEDIAAEAGFSKAALYTYYKDKETIFLSLANRDFEILFETMTRSVNQEVGFFENLDKILLIWFTYFGKYFNFILASLHFLTHLQDQAHQVPLCHMQSFKSFKERFSSITDIFTKIVAAGKARGEIESAISNHVIVIYILSLMRGVLLEWTVQGAQGDVDKEIGQLMLFIKNGIGSTR